MWRASPRHSIHSVPCATRSQHSSTRLIVGHVVGGVCSRVPGTPAVRVPLPGPRRMHDLVRPRRTSARVVSPANGYLTARYMYRYLRRAARRSWNGAGNVPVGTLRIGNVPGRPPGNQPASLSFARRVETADLVFALKRYYV